MPPMPIASKSPAVVMSTPLEVPLAVIVNGFAAELAAVLTAKRYPVPVFEAESLRLKRLTPDPVAAPQVIEYGNAAMENEVGAVGFWREFSVTRMPPLNDTEPLKMVGPLNVFVPVKTLFVSSAGNVCCATAKAVQIWTKNISSAILILMNSRNQDRVRIRVKGARRGDNSL
jgi:hypothetical protein